MTKNKSKNQGRGPHPRIRMYGVHTASHQMNLNLPNSIHRYSSATARYCLDQLAPMLNQWDKRDCKDEDAGVTAMQFYTALVNYAVLQREALMKTFEEVA